MNLRRRFSWFSASLSAALLAVASESVAAAAAYEKASAVELQEVLLSVSINGEPTGKPVILVRGADNQLYATAEQLAAWRITHGRLPTVSRGGEHLHLINALPGLRLELDEATQTLSIAAQPESLQPTRLSYAPVSISDEVVGGTGAFINYDVSGQLAKDETRLGGTFETGVFSKWGVGIATFVGRWSGAGAELVRLDTSWTIDDPDKMRSLRVGDGITRGGVGGNPLRFSGIQIARNFAVQPGFVTMPLPALSGSAAVPSVVEVYVNDALRDSRSVRPGPFEITDVPIVTGSGEVQLVVRDLLGREQLLTQSYYASSSLLRQGLQDYSYEVGFLRRSFGQKSHDYGSLMVSATHRYGVSNNFTAEVHAEASQDVQVAGLAGNIKLGNIGNLETSVGASRSALGGGLSGGIKFERRTRGLSVAFSADINSERFRSLGWTLERRPPASVIQAFAGVPLDFGSVGVSYVRRRGRGDPDVEYASANASLRLGRRANLQLALRKSVKRDGDLSADLALVLPFGRRTSSSAGATLTNNRLAYKTTIHRNVPIGQGFGYQFAASSGAFRRIDARATVHTSFGAHDAQFTSTDGRRGVRLSTAGGFGALEGDVFASRKLDQSFGIVKVGDYRNVRVYADNQLVGRTSDRGTLVVPRLRPYERNKIRIELADLPLEAEIDGDERIIRPFFRHGVHLDFNVKPSTAALIRVVLEDGTPLPPGSLVTIEGQQSEFVSAPGGEIYLTDLRSTNAVLALWNGGSCRFQLPFTESTAAQTNLGLVQCIRVQ